MSQYAIIVGNNGYRHTLSNDCELSKAIKKYHDDSKSISCIALGPKRYFAVICNDNGSTYHGPDDFKSKMKEITRNEIKHISFGCNDQWAITMKNGCVHGSILQNTNCLKCINEHNGKISYVSLCNEVNSWIVGYNDNNYSNGDSVSVKMTSFLDGIKTSKTKIKLVEIGGNDEYFVQYQTGFRWVINTEFSDWFKDTSSKFTSITLYNNNNRQRVCNNLNVINRQNLALKNKCNKLEKEKKDLKTENEELQKQIQRFHGNNIESMELDDLYELEGSLQTAIGRIYKEIEGRHKNDVLCITCLKNKKEIVFVPCHHLSMCQFCANRLTNDLCPICQTHIENKIKIFQ